MSWLFSQALVAEYLPANCSDGEPCAQWNVMPTQRGFWHNDKMMESSRLSRFGPTLKLLTVDLGEALLTSYLAAFPVKTSAPQDKGQESAEAKAGCGEKWRASFAKYDRSTSLWRTHQYSLLGGLVEYSETWPKQALMRDGECWERQTLVPPMIGSGSGSSQKWQTPVADDAVNRTHGKVNSRGEPKLSAQVKIPTPRANDSEKRGNFNLKNPRNGLAAFARKWPTPTFSAHKGATTTPRKDGRTRANDRLDYAIAAQVGLHGQLNPEFVEWLMGWPIGWTELRPLAMDKYREWQQKHSFNFLSSGNCLEGRWWS